MALAEKGIEYNARTTFETACYYHFGPNKTLGESVDLLLEGISESIIDNDDVNNERNAILDEESRNRFDASQYLWRLSYAGLWPQSSLASGFFGNKESINSIRLDDIKRFYNRYYQSKNAVFLIFGPAKDRQKILEKLDAFTWGSERVAAKYPKETFPKTQTVIVEPRKDGNQLWVSIGWRTAPESGIKGAVIGEAVSGVFASGWISLLVNKLRVLDNVSYWVESDFADFSDTGYVRFSFLVEKESLEKGIRAVLEEVQRVRDRAISNEAFSKIRFSFLSDLSRRYLDIYELMYLYGLPAISGRPILSANDFIKALNSLKKEDIENYVHKHMVNTNISIAIVGDITQKQAKKIEEVIKEFPV